MTQMSLHRVIAEIKHLENTQVSLPEMVFFSPDGATRMGKTVADALAASQSRIDAELAKIERLVKLKVARNKANSITTLELCGKQVTIDEALAMKSQLHRYEFMVNELKNQTVQAVLAETRQKQDMNTAVDSQIKTLSSGNNKPSELAIKAIRDSVQMMYPGKVFKAQNIGRIEALEEMIKEMTLELDYRLSEVNASTVVEID